VLFVLALPVRAEADMYKGNDPPDSVGQAAEGAVRVRRYAPHIAAEGTVSGNRAAAINAGFRVLAGDIFGDNEAREQVAMTTPKRMAVLRFPGVPTTSAPANRVQELRVWTTSNGLAITGQPQFMFYDTPFRLPRNRRNKVAFTLN
jgi:SOUL heme-binding protein